MGIVMDCILIQGAATAFVTLGVCTTLWWDKYLHHLYFLKVLDLQPTEQEDE